MSIKDKESFGSHYLYAESLLSGGEFRTVTVTIEQVIPPNTLTAANGKLIDKYTLKFVGKDKLLVLCATNVAMVTFCCGEQLDRCVGKTITLQPRYIKAFGDDVVAIRVMPQPGVKVRRSILQRLGTKATWAPCEVQKEREPGAEG